MMIPIETEKCLFDFNQKLSEKKIITDAVVCRDRFPLVFDGFISNI